MPLNIKSIAVSIAVVCFFGMSLIGSISGLSSFTCCKRAIAGAILAYIAGVWLVKGVNAVLISAMVTNQMNEQEDEDSDDRD